MYPVIEHVQRTLGWQREDPVEAKLAKLEQGLAGFSFTLDESIPLMAGLLSLPLPEERYAALTLSPQQQRQQTNDTLVAWMLEEAERQPLLAVWEDLHWADLSTLELLGLLINQAPTVAMMNVLAHRPEFEPPWPVRTHLTPITLNRLEHAQVKRLVTRRADGKQLPPEVVEHIVEKTDGVPLYVEELTKMLLTSDLMRVEGDHYLLTGPLLGVAIPDTLQGSLMARLDQLQKGKEIAQLGSVLGREFPYAIVHMLSVLDEPQLQEALAQLVEAELIYQRGRPPKANYIFKHALIQDAAYASLLRSTRQQLHRQVAQILETQFSDIVKNQPELAAHHYTEANQPAMAIPYWQRAGQQAEQRSAYSEAIGHIKKGLSLLPMLPDTPDRSRQELTLQLALGVPLQRIKGYGVPEVEATYRRAQDLSQQLDDPIQLFEALAGLQAVHMNRQEANYHTAHELGEQMVSLAQHQQDSRMLLRAHAALGFILQHLGDPSASRSQSEAGLRLYHRHQHVSSLFLYGIDVVAVLRRNLIHALWLLGYPDQAMQQSHELVALSQRLSHPSSLGQILNAASLIHGWRGEWCVAQGHSERAMALAAEYGFPEMANGATIRHGWIMVALGQPQAGLEQMCQGLDAVKASTRQLGLTLQMAQLAAAHWQLGDAAAGMRVVQEALALSDRTGERFWEPELHRLHGELLLSQSSGQDAEAVSCFQHALDVARQQVAKSLELRASMSLARLWQARDERQEAYDLLAPVYGSFTEGFDTADLIEARHLLDELSAETNPPMA